MTGPRVDTSSTADGHVVHREHAGVPRRPHLFDGRILSADMLAQERSELLADLRRLGRTVGHGVVEGLRVGGEGSAVLSVGRGFGLTRSGRRLCLETDLAFHLFFEPAGASAPRGFRACGSGGPKTPVVAGTYLLVVGPDAAFLERAPRVAAFGTAGRGTGECGARWAVDGLAFRLLPLPADAPCDPASARFRNLLAFWCWNRRGRWVDSLGGWAEGVDTVPGLDPQDELALAVLRWDGSGVRVLDEWAARRPPLPPAPEPMWAGMAGAAALRTGLARFLGFQAFLDGLFTRGETGDRLADRARFLPPAGLIPLAWHGSPGFPPGFLAGLVATEELEQALTGPPATPEEVRLALERSWRCDAVDLEREPRLALHRVEGYAAGSPFCDENGEASGDVAREAPPEPLVEDMAAHDVSWHRMARSASAPLTFGSAWGSGALGEAVRKAYEALESYGTGSDQLRRALQKIDLAGRSEGTGPTPMLLFVHRVRDLFTISVATAGAPAPQPGSIRVTVVTPTGGARPGVPVRLRSAQRPEDTALTDAKGVALFGGLPAGGYTVRLRVAYRSLVLEAGATNEVTLVHDQLGTTGSIVVHGFLESGGSANRFHVVVRDAAGEPVAQGSDSSSGVITLGGLPRGTYELLAESDPDEGEIFSRFEPPGGRVELGEGGTASVNAYFRRPF